MSRHDPGWVDIAQDQYRALPPDTQRLIDARLVQLLDEPDGHGCSYDPRTGQWTTTDREGAGIILYTFRPDRPRLVVLRLIY